MFRRKIVSFTRGVPFVLVYLMRGRRHVLRNSCRLKHRHRPSHSPIRFFSRKRKSSCEQCQCIDVKSFQDLTMFLSWRDVVTRLLGGIERVITWCQFVARPCAVTRFTPAVELWHGGVFMVTLLAFGYVYNIFLCTRSILSTAGPQVTTVRWGIQCGHSKTKIVTEALAMRPSTHAGG